MEGVHITRSRRKSIELSIDDNLQIAVKAPLWVTDRAIDHFIAQKADWISRQKAAKAAYLQAHPPLTEAEVEVLRRRAKAELPPRVTYYSQILGVTPTGIKITSAKKRFGSCNGKNSICFSLYLMQYPPAGGKRAAGLQRAGAPAAPLKAKKHRNESRYGAFLFCINGRSDGQGLLFAPNGTPQLANVPMSRLQGQPGVALGDRRL